MERIGRDAPVWLVWAAAALLLWTASSQATVIVRFEPSATTVQQGNDFTVDIRVDLGDEPVIGWGLDLAFDMDVVSLSGPPAIGPYWLAGYAPDGDQLTGSVDAFADPDGDGIFGSVQGNNVLLATLTFSADAVGVTNLLASHTPSDLNEGFPLDPIGFASVSYQPIQIFVIPEPMTAMFLMVFAVGGRLSRPRRRRQ